MAPIARLGSVLLVAASILMPTGGVAIAEPVPAAISQVEVKLFYANSGRFSSNLATKKDLALWNVVIGEGSGVDGPSENTLLLVTVIGTPKGDSPGLQLKVTAKTERAKLLDRTCDVGIFNTNGNWYAPFLLYDTGCEPVEVRAQLTDGKESGPPVTFTIPFQCGE
jgi:hypothetical protein